VSQHRSYNIVNNKMHLMLLLI